MVFPSIQTVSLTVSDTDSVSVWSSFPSFLALPLQLQQLAKAETRQHMIRGGTDMVKRMERHVRALSHPEQPSPKQRYMKTPLASADERKNGRRKRVRICSIFCYVLANVRELSF